MQPRWGRAGLDEVAEDPEDLLGIGDGGPLAAQARLPAQTRTRIGEPQRVQRKGSTSYTFASSRAQAKRDSLSDTD